MPNTNITEFAGDKAIISIHDDPVTPSLNLQNRLCLMSNCRYG